MKKHLETGLMIICAAAFFGFIYPELCLTPDTVKVVESPVSQEEAGGTGKKVAGIYNNSQALPALPVKIRFRIRDLVSGIK